MIKIIKGTYGYFDGKRVFPKTCADAPFTLPAEKEKQLVDKGVAIYVDAAPEKKDDAPDRNVGNIRSMTVVQLKEYAEDKGIDISEAKKKDEIIALIEENEDT